MKRKRWVPFVLLAGVLALAHNAIYLGRELFPARPVGLGDDEEDAADASADEAPAQQALALLSAGEVRSYLAELPEPGRSPFLSLAEFLELEEGGSALGLPVVSGTLWSSRRRVAWIAGLPRAEGDHIDGFRVERIGRDAVVLGRSEERFDVGVATPGVAAPAGSTANTDSEEGEADVD